jgi:general secretion pathway protein A
MLEFWCENLLHTRSEIYPAIPSERSMFLEYYKLQHQPFGVTPDPRFLYFGATHREAYASLLYAIETKRGFSALVAEPGMGKTSLLARLLETLSSSARTAYLFQTDGDSRDLLHGLLNDLGIDNSNKDLVAMHNALNHALIEEERSGKQVVVILDEAQNLDEQSLETVRLLSNFETSTQKLMHIVLAGQPGLAERLEEPGLTQLRQRVSSIIRLERFNRDETIDYIGHRLRTAGYEGPSLFSAEALDAIARVSQGIPRNINNICFQALSIGFATHSKTIGPEILREVVSDFDYAPKHNHRATEPRVSSPERAPENFPPLFAPLPHSWEFASETPERSPRRFRIAALACLAIPLLVTVALSDPKLGLNETVPGRVSESVVNAVLSSTDPTSDFVPAWPARLKAPAAPVVETTGEKLLESATAPATTPDDGQDGEAESVESAARQPTAIIIPKTMTLTDVARRYLGESSRAAVTEIRTLNPQFQMANQIVPKGTRVFLPADATFESGLSEPDENRNAGGKRIEHAASRSEPYPYQGPANVQVLHRETLFQFALEHYGKANWAIVEEICRANPKLHGAYDILSVGQWIQLPAEPSETPGSSSPAQSYRR